ncbi:MAG: elongation factor P [Simkaniaceae bacterium]|nr:elongation factor P [Simkaniaceae bacterium]
MAQIETNQFRNGAKVEMQGEPYTIVGVEFVKPGKGQAFTRTKLKHLMTGRVIEKSFRSGEKLDLADVEETNMRMLYKDGEDVVFMDDKTFDQVSVPSSNLGEAEPWMKEEILYDLIFYKGNVVSVMPPTFMELVITETEPGIKGDTASGRVLKPAIVETSAKVQVPIFINEGEKIKVDTRTSEYVSRV